MWEFLLLASGLLSTTYGHGEVMCGDVDKPRKCEAGAVTASGIEFDPKLPQIAIAAPKNLIVRPTWIKVRLEDGPCVKVHLVDKMNPRYIGTIGFDLTPKAVELLTGKAATSYWSGRIFVCNLKDLVLDSKVGASAPSIYKGPYAPTHYRPIVTSPNKP